MIHILVFVIKAIVKAINANSSATNTSKNVVNGTNDYPNSVQSTSTKATVNKVYPKSTSSQSDNRGIAVVLAMITSFCCSINFVSNLILALILKKTVHVLLCIFLITGVVGIIYTMDMKKKENLATLPQITFNDTLVLNLTTEEHVKLEITNYLEEKYRSWIMVGALSFDDKVKADRYINLMTSDLYFYTFDNMMIDSENIETTSLYNVMNDEPEEEIQDKYMVSKSIIYIPSEMMNEQFKFNADKLKECIVTSKMKNDKSQYMFIIGIVVLFIIALFQSLYLWILFFKRRNKNNTTSQADSIESHQYKPEVTINSQEAKSRRAEASSHQPKATSITTDSIIKGDRLDINKIDIYQFLSIPVMSYSQALLIIAERNDKGKYLDIEDLKSRNNLDPKIASALSERIYFG